MLAYLLTRPQQNSEEPTSVIHEDQGNHLPAPQSPASTIPASLLGSSLSVVKNPGALEPFRCLPCSPQSPRTLIITTPSPPHPVGANVHIPSTLQVLSRSLFLTIRYIGNNIIPAKHAMTTHRAREACA